MLHCSAGVVIGCYLDKLLPPCALQWISAYQHRLHCLAWPFVHCALKCTLHASPLCLQGCSPCFWLPSSASSPQEHTPAPVPSSPVRPLQPPPPLRDRPTRSAALNNCVVAAEALVFAGIPSVAGGAAAAQIQGVKAAAPAVTLFGSGGTALDPFVVRQTPARLHVHIFHDQEGWAEAAGDRGCLHAACLLPDCSGLPHLAAPSYGAVSLMPAGSLLPAGR